MIDFVGKKIREVLGEEAFEQVAAVLGNESLEELQRLADEKP